MVTMELECTCYRHTLDILDHERVVELIGEQMVFIGYEYDHKQVHYVLENAMKAESRSALWVAYEGDSAVGFAFGNVCCGLESGGDYLWLNELYVGQRYRKQGVGSFLLETAQKWAKKAGCTYFALVTHPRNERAQKLYEDEGFELESLVWVDKYL